MNNDNQPLQGFSSEDISRINAIDPSDPNSIAVINSMDNTIADLNSKDDTIAELNSSKIDNSTNPNLSKDLTPIKPYFFKSKNDQIYFENTMELMCAIERAGGCGGTFLESAHAQNFLAILANNNIQLKAKYLGV